MSSKKISSPMTQMMGQTPSAQDPGNPGRHDSNFAPFDKPHSMGPDTISERFFEAGVYKDPPGKPKIDSPMESPIALKGGK